MQGILFARDILNISGSNEKKKSKFGVPVCAYFLTDKADRTEGVCVCVCVKITAYRILDVIHSVHYDCKHRCVPT